MDRFSEISVNYSVDNFVENDKEKEMATHSSILAWEIPWIVEPGGMQPMGSQRVRHSWATKHAWSMHGPPGKSSTCHSSVSEPRPFPTLKVSLLPFQISSHHILSLFSHWLWWAELQIRPVPHFFVCISQSKKKKREREKKEFLKCVCKTKDLEETKQC